MIATPPAGTAAPPPPASANADRLSAAFRELLTEIEHLVGTMKRALDGHEPVFPQCMALLALDRLRRELADAADGLLLRPESEKETPR